LAKAAVRRGEHAQDQGRGSSRPSIWAASARAGPTLIVDILGLKNLLEQPVLVVVSRIGNWTSGQRFCVPAQDLGADRMKSAHPGHAFDKTGEVFRSVRAFSRAALLVNVTLQYFMRPRPTGRDEMGDAGGQNARLATPRRPGRERAIERLDRPRWLMRPSR